MTYVYTSYWLEAHDKLHSQLRSQDVRWQLWLQKMHGYLYPCVNLNRSLPKQIERDAIPLPLTIQPPHRPPGVQHRGLDAGESGIRGHLIKQPCGVAGDLHAFPFEWPSRPGEPRWRCIKRDPCLCRFRDVPVSIERHALSAVIEVLPSPAGLWSARWLDLESPSWLSRRAFSAQLLTVVRLRVDDPFAISERGNWWTQQ